MNYQCFLTKSETERYTVKAKNFRELKKKLVDKFTWGGLRWYKNTLPKGYPKGSMRFILKSKKIGFMGRRIVCKTYLLIIPREEE